MDLLNLVIYEISFVSQLCSMWVLFLDGSFLSESPMEYAGKKIKN